MTPDELARLHPRLYHVTAPGAWPSIAASGLLSAAGLVAHLEDGHDALADRRAAEVVLRHPIRGTATLNDNAPLHMGKLGSCLDDGLTARDWLAMLNERVFFWVDRGRVERLLGARTNRVRAREVLVFDTLGLVSAHAERVEISPINSGATLRLPPRRGRATFAPLLTTDYAAWQRRRGLSSPDRIVEVVVRGGVPDAGSYRCGKVAMPTSVE